MENRLTYKAQELIDAYKTAEEKWTEDLNLKDEFIRRRDHTIVTQIETINSISKENENLSNKIKKLQDEALLLQKKLDVEKAEKQKLRTENTSLKKKIVESNKEAEMWKLKYKNFKLSWKEECKRRADSLSDDEDNHAEAAKKPNRGA